MQPLTQLPDSLPIVTQLQKQQVEKNYNDILNQAKVNPNRVVQLYELAIKNQRVLNNDWVTKAEILLGRCATNSNIPCAKEKLRQVNKQIQSTTIQYYQGILYEQEKREGEARKCYEEALKNGHQINNLDLPPTELYKQLQNQQRKRMHSVMVQQPLETGAGTNVTSAPIPQNSAETTETTITTQSSSRRKRQRTSSSQSTSQVTSPSASTTPHSQIHPISSPTPPQITDPALKKAINSLNAWKLLHEGLGYLSRGKNKKINYLLIRH